MPYRFLGADEAAEYLQLRRVDLEELVKAQAIPFEARGDRLVFRRQDLDDWASGRILASAAPGPESRREAVTWERRCALTSTAPLLSELISPGQIQAAMTAKTKAAVLHDLVAVAERTGWVCDRQELTISLRAREALCSTAVPGGVAFLHPRSPDPYRFSRSFVVLGRTVRPIYWGAPDGQPTDLFFLLCCQDDRLHLHALARLCLVARKTELLTQLRAAPDSPALQAALVAAEQAALTKATEAKGVSAHKRQ